MADNEHGGCGGGAGNRAEVMGDAKYRPIIRYGTEVRIFGVCKLAVRDELLAYDDILTGLVGSAG